MITYLAVVFGFCVGWALKGAMDRAATVTADLSIVPDPITDVWLDPLELPLFIRVESRAREIAV